MEDFIVTTARTSGRRRKWDELNAVAVKVAARHPGVWAKAHAAASEFFAAALADKEHTRRPSVGLRLVVAGKPEAAVSIRPGWNKWKREVLPDIIEAEITVTRISANGLGLPTAEVEAAGTADGMRFYRLSALNTQESTARLLATLEEFAANPAAVMARSKDRCCVCRHALTDAVSRTRGIGPECLRGNTRLLRWLEERWLERLAAATATPQPQPGQAAGA
jgi:hypothetical protein